MKNLYVKICISVLFVIVICFLSIPRNVFSQENKTDKLNEILNSLDSDTKNIYDKYVILVDKISEETDTTSLFDEFKTSSDLWKTLFNSSQTVYQKYISDSDVSISNVAKLALESTQIGLQALQKYDMALGSDTSANYSYYAEQGDALIIDSNKKHIEAVDQYNLLVDNYNDESGVTDAYSTRTYLIIASIFFSLISVFLFFKSKVRSSLSAEAMRAGVFQNMFGNSLAMSIGLIVTTIGYAYALETGGTYYILWGLVVFGGWRFLVGLFNYFSNGRKILNQLAEQEKINSTKLSFNKDIDNTIENQSEDKFLFCTNCGTRITNKTSKCPNCGYKLH